MTAYSFVSLIPYSSTPPRFDKSCDDLRIFLITSLRIKSGWHESKPFVNSKFSTRIRITLSITPVSRLIKKKILWIQCFAL